MSEKYKVIITSTQEEEVEVEATSEEEARDTALSGEFLEVVSQDSYNWDISSIEETT
tara:strand:+ start:73 stop:243 length:171 start_codon:yes stop_codon:yes gene_type:complete